MHAFLAVAKLLAMILGARVGSVRSPCVSHRTAARRQDVLWHCDAPSSAHKSGRAWSPERTLGHQFGCFVRLLTAAEADTRLSLSWRLQNQLHLPCSASWSPQPLAHTTSVVFSSTSSLWNCWLCIYSGYMLV